MSKSRTELFKKAILVAVGATAVTVEKINGVIDELVAKGELSEGQAKSFKEEVKEKAKAEKESLEKKIQESTQKAVAKILKDIGIATVKDLEKLEKKLNAKIEGKEYIEEDCIEIEKVTHSECCDCDDCHENKETAKHSDDCKCDNCLD
ncbi:MAG: hypothetical protein AB1782_00345 [Cyanobacteriota bacterium]